MAKKRPLHLQKLRFQISISKPAARFGKELAALERRSFSNVLEVLIEREAVVKGLVKEAA